METGDEWWFGQTVFYTGKGYVKGAAKNNGYKWMEMPTCAYQYLLYAELYRSQVFEGMQVLCAV